MGDLRFHRVLRLKACIRTSCGAYLTHVLTFTLVVRTRTTPASFQISATLSQGDLEKVRSKRLENRVDTQVILMAQHFTGEELTVLTI